MGNVSISPYQADIPVVVLIGKLGSGKTTIFNLLTGSRALVGAGYKTVTYTAQSAMSKKANMFVIDTPGLEEVDDACGHISSQLAALQTVPVSCIVFIEECDRAAVLVKKLMHPIMMIGHKELVSIIVTHVDTFYDNKGLDARSIEADKVSLIHEVCTKLNVPEQAMLLVASRKNVFPGTTPNTNPDAVVAHVLNCLASTPVRITLSEDQVKRFHAISGVSAAEEKAAASMVKDCEAKLHAGKMFALELEKSTTTDTVLIELMRVLQAEVQITRDRVHRKCYEKPNMNMIYWQTNARLRVALNEVVVYCKSLLTYDLDDASDLRNTLKKCPYCHLVWVKVEGCDGETTCGNRPSSSNSRDGGTGGTFQPITPVALYIEKGANGHYVVRRKAIQQQAASATTTSKNFRLPFGVAPANPQGCGRRFEWKLAPTLSDSEFKEVRSFLIRKAVTNIEKEIAELAKEEIAALEASDREAAEATKRQQIKENFKRSQATTRPVPSNADTIRVLPSEVPTIPEAQAYPIEPIPTAYAEAWDLSAFSNPTAARATERNSQWACEECKTSNSSIYIYCCGCGLSREEALVGATSGDATKRSEHATKSENFGQSKGSLNEKSIEMDGQSKGSLNEKSIEMEEISTPKNNSFEWSCSVCTFLNSKSDVCTLCGAVSEKSMEESNESFYKTEEIVSPTKNELEWGCSVCTALNCGSNMCAACGELRGLDKNVEWECVQCTTRNEILEVLCTSCGQERDVDENIEWRCTLCSSRNKFVETTCTTCGNKKTSSSNAQCWMCEQCNCTNPPACAVCENCHSKGMFFFEDRMSTNQTTTCWQCSRCGMSNGSACALCDHCGTKQSLVV